MLKKISRKKTQPDNRVPDQPTQPTATETADATLPPLRSVHSQSLAELLETLQISIAISTYQAGHIVVLRHDGNAVNTHFRSCDRPMGMAVSGPKLTVGGAREIVEFWNMPDLCERVDERSEYEAVNHTA